MRIANQLNERLTLNQVAKQLDVHIGTVHRWTLRGVRGKRLRSFLVGGRRYISRSDLERFIRPADQFLSAPSARNKIAQETLRSFGIHRRTEGDE